MGAWRACKEIGCDYNAGWRADETYSPISTKSIWRVPKHRHQEGCLFEISTHPDYRKVFCYWLDSQKYVFIVQKNNFIFKRGINLNTTLMFTGTMFLEDCSLKCEWWKKWRVSNTTQRSDFACIRLITSVKLPFLYYEQIINETEHCWI